MIDSKKYNAIPVYAVDDADGRCFLLNLREIPLIGDTILVLKKGAFKVIERGQITDTAIPSWGWVRLENVQDPNGAPGSDNYRFMEKFPEVDS